MEQIDISGRKVSSAMSESDLEPIKVKSLYFLFCCGNNISDFLQNIGDSE